MLTPRLVNINVKLENSSNSPLLTRWGIILMAVICNNASGKNPQRFLTSLKANVTFLQRAI